MAKRSKAILEDRLKIEALEGPSASRELLLDAIGLLEGVIERLPTEASMRKVKVIAQREVA